MKYEWDTTKAAKNLENHKVAFEAAHEFEWDTSLIKEDARQNYGETRYVALGLINGRLHTMVFALRGSVVRVISLRKSNHREVKHYEKVQ
jgi:uncharacterized protein